MRRRRLARTNHHSLNPNRPPAPNRSPPLTAPTTTQAAAAAPKVIHRKDYAPPPYMIDSVDLNFDLNEEATTVTAKLAMRPNYDAAAAAAPPPLVLHGRKDVRLVSLKAGGERRAALRRCAVL